MYVLSFACALAKMHTDVLCEWVLNLYNCITCAKVLILLCIAWMLYNEQTHFIIYWYFSPFHKMSHARTVAQASRRLSQLPRDNGFFLAPVQPNPVTPPLAENNDITGKAILTLDCWDWMGSLSHHPGETEGSPCHHSFQIC